jgi:hypothetical protein
VNECIVLKKKTHSAELGRFTEENGARIFAQSLVEREYGLIRVEHVLDMKYWRVTQYVVMWGQEP